MAKKIKMPEHSKEELKTMVEKFFEKGGVIKVYPTRYATGAYRATLTSVHKQK